MLSISDILPANAPNALPPELAGRRGRHRRPRRRVCARPRGPFGHGAGAVAGLRRDRRGHPAGTQYLQDVRVPGPHGRGEPGRVLPTGHGHERRAHGREGRARAAGRRRAGRLRFSLWRHLPRRPAPGVPRRLQGVAQRHVAHVQQGGIFRAGRRGRPRPSRPRRVARRRRAGRRRRPVEPHPRGGGRRRQTARVGPHRLPGRAPARGRARAPVERRRVALGWREDAPGALSAAARRAVQPGGRLPQQQVRRRLEHVRRHGGTERTLRARSSRRSRSCSARSRPGKCGCCATASR